MQGVNGDLGGVRQLLVEKNFRGVVDWVDQKPAEGRSPDDWALRGLAYFWLEDYAEAELSFDNACQASGSSVEAEWQEMRSLCRANVDTDVRTAVPTPTLFDRETLLQGPRPGTLPPTGNPKPAASPGKEFLTGLGNGLGVVCTGLMDRLTTGYGRLFGYRDRVWTNWYHRSTPIGILTLAYMRELLNAHNLKDTYPSGALTAFQPSNLTPPPGAEHFRTADGSWNNFENPMEGAAGTRFPRNVELSKIRPETGDALMTPDPRTVSLRLLRRGSTMKEVPFLNLLAASWIQFQNDDWVNHGEHLIDEYHEIVLAEDDPARIKFGQTSLRIGKTQPDPTRQEKEDAPVSYINEVTHWWDGSQIYGSDEATQRRLRSGREGKMILNPDGTLPRDERGVEQSGMIRNWWVGLSMLHTLFVREHNAICDMLRRAHPDWEDDRLFNVARLINSAVMAKIHTVEWTPAILPNAGLTAGLNANWYGILTNLFHKGKDRNTVAAVNIRNPELGGVVGNPINKHGCHYGLAEEFVEVYRLHSLLPESLQIRKKGSEEIRNVAFVETRRLGAPKLVDEASLSDLFYSFGNQHPGQLVLNNYPHFMRELSIPGNPMFDMASVDILRARERGVPRYNEFRRQLGLNPITRFEDLFPDPGSADDRRTPAEIEEQNEQLETLRTVYGNDVEKLDLLVGTLGECVRPTNFGFGETMFQIFILNATRRLQADRFYTDCYDEQHYTKEGLAWIDDVSLKKVILRHYPELASTGLGNVTNAFEPWDTSERLEKSRHYLREFDPMVEGDPWQGDAFK